MCARVDAARQVGDGGEARSDDPVQGARDVRDGGGRGHAGAGSARGRRRARHRGRRADGP